MHKRIVSGKTVKNLPSTPDDDSSTNVIIPVPRISLRNKCRKCERPNYIPDRTPTYSDRESWNHAYNEPLLAMYRSVGLMVEEKYPSIRIDWRDPKYHDAFHKLIYHCSSKYITSYIEERDEDSVTAFKELSMKIKDGKSKKETKLSSQACVQAD